MDIRRQMFSATPLQRNLYSASVDRNLAMRRISSGLRINSAADDAAGLAISETMRAQIRGLDQAFRNTQDASALIQTAEGGVASINEGLQRIRELVVQAANDTYRSPEQNTRNMIQIEIIQRIAEIEFVARQLQHNQITLLDGTLSRSTPSPSASASPLGQIQPFWRVASLYQAQMPVPQNGQVSSVQPASTPTQIHLYSLADGMGVAGEWNFNNGVLTIENDGVFQINGGISTNNRIVVNSGVNADITLNNVTIEYAEGAALDMRGATVNLRLVGDNMLATSDTAVGSAGIQTTGGHLTISGTGRLYAISRVGGAGIGGGSTGLLGGAGLAFGEDGGTIVINSGTVRAVAYGGAGIGGGSGFISGGTGGNIYIHGGTIIAQNYRGGAGIGGGAGAGGSGGNITITGGTITATGGTVQPGAPLQGGAGIGGGWGGSGGNINISGGTINTTGGNYAAGIGGGWGGGGGTVNVSGGIVNSTGGRDAASIGGGIGGAGVDMTISGGLVQIGIGQWVEGSVDVQGGNFSIHDPDLVTNIHHGGDSAFRIQITLQHANGSSVPFGPHMPVTYTVNGMTINAITDSDGNLFMYLPEDFSGNVQMTFDGRTFRGQLVVDPDHGNQLVLTRDYEDGGFIGTRPNPNGRTLHFQVGPNSGHSLFLNIEAMDARTLGLVDERGFSIINVSQDAGASISQQLQILDSALSHVSREWAMLGAMQNRLDFIARGLDVVNENLSDANSRILNADMAMETGRLARANFRHQASITVLAQANQASDRALWLLQDPQPQALN